MSVILSCALLICRWRAELRGRWYGGEFSTFSTLFSSVLVLPTLQLGSTLYRGVYPPLWDLPSTVGSTLYPVKFSTH